MPFPDSREPCLLGFPNRFSSKGEVMEEIEKRDSAAAVLCNISRRVQSQEPPSHLVKDIIGIVALLGRVHSIQLSRLHTFISFSFAPSKRLFFSFSHFTFSVFLS